jgi:hypothetical protein
MAENVRRSIEFQFGVDLGSTENSIAGLERQLGKLQEEFKNTEIGTAEFTRLGQEIQKTQSKLKTLDERFEGLGAEQKATAIAESFNVVVGAVGAVTGALVALGVESKAIENVERRLLGIITVVTSLREVSNGLVAFNKVWPLLTANITKAAAALRAFALANPFTAILAGIVAVTAATYALIKANEDEVQSLEDVNKAYDKRSSRYKEAIGLRNREAEIIIQTTEREKGAIAAAEKRIELAEDLALQARVDANIADEETAQAIIAQEKLVKVLEDELTVRQNQTAFARRISDLLGDEIQLTEKLKTAKQDLFFLNKIYNDSQLDVQQAEENLAAARLKLEEERKKQAEENTRKAKEARDKAERKAEELAKRAVKQLEDQRQATEDLINLYTELYPEKVSGGQFEFNTELDKTNFFLKEQLDILFALNTEYENLGDQLEEITDDFGESFFSSEQLEVFKKLRDAQKTTLDLQLEDLRETYLEDLSLFSDNEEVKTQLTEQYEKDRAQLRRQFAIQTASDLLGITSNFLNVIADVNQQSLELQLAQAAGNQAKIEQINKEALERQKKLRIAQIVVSTAESVINAFTSTSQIPPPFGQIIGAALAASYVALGAKSIATVNATTLDGGTAGGGFNNIPGGGGAFSLPGGGGVSTTPSTGAILPGLGGGRVAGAPTIGTIGQEPLRAYVLAGDVTNGVQANIALNNRRRLAG